METRSDSSFNVEKQLVHHIPQGPNIVSQRPAQSSTYLCQNPQPEKDLTSVDQRMPVNQTHTVLVMPSHGVLDAGGFRHVSTSQLELTNSDIDWISPAHEKLLLLRKMYLSDAILIVNKTREMRQRATDAATVNKWERSRICAEKMLKFISMSRSDLSHWRKDNLYRMMNNLVLYFNQRASYSRHVRQTQPVEGSPNHFKPPEMRQRENYLQFSSTAASLHQSLRFPENSVTSSPVSSSAGVHNVNASPIINSFQFNLMRSTCPDDKQSSNVRTDSLTGSLEVVNSISSSVYKSPLRDTAAVRDLAGDNSNCDYGNATLHGTIMLSRIKRRLDNATWNDLTSETEFCQNGSIKRLKNEPKYHLLQEIKEINQKLIEVTVNVMNVKVSGEGTLIRCSYVPVGHSVKMKRPNTSQQMFPTMFLDLIVDADYPNSSPTVLNTTPPGCSDGEEGRTLWMKAKSKFILSLGKLSLPISVKEMAGAWNVSAREVLLEFAGKMGGGDFTSRYGKWERL